MNFLNLFKKKDQKPQEQGAFSTFFLTSSIEKQEKLLRRAAEEANKDQQELYRRAQLKLKSQEQ